MPVEQQVLHAWVAQSLREMAESEDCDVESFLWAKNLDPEMVALMMARYQEGVVILDRGFRVVEETGYQVLLPDSGCVAWATMPVAGGRVRTLSLVKDGAL